jgi:hypothetical protein
MRKAFVLALAVSSSAALIVALSSSPSEASCVRSGTTLICSDGSSLRTIGKPGYESQTYTDRFGSFTTYQGRFQGGTGAYRRDPRPSRLAPMPRRSSLNWQGH